MVPLFQRWPVMTRGGRVHLLWWPTRDHGRRRLPTQKGRRGPARRPTGDPPYRRRTTAAGPNVRPNGQDWILENRHGAFSVMSLAVTSGAYGMEVISAAEA